jgi:hypothetical protein
MEGLFDLDVTKCVKDCPESGVASCRVHFDRNYSFVEDRSRYVSFQR